MRKIFFLLYGFGVFIFFGCSQVYKITVKQNFSLDEGRILILSHEEHSSVNLEIPRLAYRDNFPFVFFVKAKLNKTNQNNAPIFSIDSFSFSENPMGFFALDANQILNSYLNFKGVLQDFSIPTPPLANHAQFGLAFSPFFGFYPTGFYSDGYYRESEFSRRILFSRYLKPTSLDSDFKGGFVALGVKDMREGALNINVKINGETHHFLLIFTKKK